MALAHNGNLTNALTLRDRLELSGAIFHTTSDTETIAYMITRERLGASSIEEAVSRAMESLEGAYSLVLMSSAKMVAARDPYGFRPLCYGRMPDGAYVAASESCALSAVGAEYVRDVLPGRSWSSVRTVWNPEESTAEPRGRRPVFLNISILPGRIL